jgi:3-dehydroquinate dehydratase-2
VRIAVVHGPNLNLLGRREPEIYGRTTLPGIEARLRTLGSELGTEIEFYQSNSEGQLIDFVQAAAVRVDGFVVNAGGLTHSSVALLDALVGVGRPYVEVHLSNLAAREAMRQHSLLTSRARGMVMGFGADGYSLAVRGLVSSLRPEGEAGAAGGS